MFHKDRPPYNLDEAQAIVAKKTAPKVTKDSIEAKIKEVRYVTDGITTICIIEMESGFKVIGHSTPASPANYDYNVGMSYAFENAFKQLWQLEGYVLCEKLSQESK